MSTKKMLIDTTHPEETRVVVLNGSLLEDFDVEVESRRQLKGNIYLAKVIRVEPSLQAAFVDYGGNRHGFLAFNEIHPDYYQIPVADREALVAEHDAAEKADEESKADDDGENAAGGVEVVGGDDSEEVEARRSRTSSRRYKIQEVIKRRQILLVQVVKEERGNKGAALTTYLSLAGRYCVLMPNTARGGGISRKIANGPERKKLKALLGELDIPKGMAVIVRTAGSKRSKTEIKRDYEYLFRLWNTIRDLTLQSTAPDLIHEEGNLIKRSIRDLYNSEIGEIIVDGEEGYRAAKNFMKLMIPSHAKKVQPYTDVSMPMLQRFQVESQLDTIHNPVVQLKSGGYIVINPTEALVSIDVNSGRSTKERNIEETALKTNLEAVDEVARQVRLRDLAGLLVIDFIDMEVSRNNAKVERRLKDAMRSDRARIQLGRISPFGLFEFSRQRLRPSIIETSSEPCPYCEGSGVRRSTDSAALFVLRAIEEEAAKGNADEIIVHTSTAAALYILNNKRPSLNDIETRNSITVVLAADDSLIPPEFRIERVRPRVGVEADIVKAKGDVNRAANDEDGPKRHRRQRKRPSEERQAETVKVVEGDDAIPSEAVTETTDDKDESTPSKRRRRGRRGGRRRSRKPSEEATANAAPQEDVPIAATQESTETVLIVSPNGSIEPEAAPVPVPVAAEVKEDEDKPAAEKPTRRGRTAKGAPRKRTSKTTADVEDKPVAAETETVAPVQDMEQAQELAQELTQELTQEQEKPKPSRRRRTARTKDKEELPEIVPEKEPKKESKKEKTEDSTDSAEKADVVNVGEDGHAETDKKPRKGWWKLR